MFHLHFINMRVLTIQKNETKRVLYSTREENEYKSQWFHVSKMENENVKWGFLHLPFWIIMCIFFCEGENEFVSNECGLFP